MIEELYNIIINEEDIHNLILMYNNINDLDIDKNIYDFIYENIFIKLKYMSTEYLEYLKNSFTNNENNIYDLISLDKKNKIYFFINLIIETRKNKDINDLIEINDSYIGETDYIFFYHSFNVIEQKVANLLNNKNLMDTINVYYNINESLITSQFYKYEIFTFIIKNIGKLENKELVLLISNCNYYNFKENDQIYWCTCIIYKIKNSEDLTEFGKIYSFVKNFKYFAKSTKTYIKTVIIEYMIKYIINMSEVIFINDNYFNIFSNNENRIRYLYKSISYLKSNNYCLYEKIQYVKNYSKYKIPKCDNDLVDYFLNYIIYSNHNTIGINEQITLYDF